MEIKYECINKTYSGDKQLNMMQSSVCCVPKLETH